MFEIKDILNIYIKYIHKRWLKNGFTTNVGPAARGKWLLCLCQVAAEGSFRLSLMEHSHNEEEKMRRKKEKETFKICIIFFGPEEDCLREFNLLLQMFTRLILSGRKVTFFISS